MSMSYLLIFLYNSLKWHNSHGEGIQQKHRAENSFLFITATEDEDLGRAILEDLFKKQTFTLDQLPFQQKEVWSYGMLFSPHIKCPFGSHALGLSRRTRQFSLYFDQHVLETLNKNSSWRTTPTTFLFISKVWSFPWMILKNSCCLTVSFLFWPAYHLWDL